MKNVNYSVSTVPEDYKCNECGATNCKLWRECCAFCPKIYCAKCAAKLSNENIKDLDENGYRSCRWGKTDQIGGYMPAVPDEEGVGYWGYTSVPESGCKWWRKLPTFQKKEKYYWKVVRKVTSIWNPTEYISANLMLPDKHTINYQLGVESKPKVAGKLFVFNTRKNARRFKDRLNNEQFPCRIMKVKVTGTPQGIDNLLRSHGLFDDDIFNKFWNKKYVDENSFSVPEGTLVVDSVTPVEFSH